MSAPVHRQRVAFAVMVASGFAGLGYQIVWTQQSALWLGHEAAAVLAVVTAFFGGLAFGAVALGGRIERSRRPERWYGALELAIAVWSVLLMLLMAPVSTSVAALTGARPSPAWQWAVAFGATFLVLLPATAAMGATLPAMERVLDRLGTPGLSIAPLYAANTFGAVVGVLAAAFWLVPEIGLLRTAAVCAALNVFCAAAAIALSSARPAPAPSSSAVAPAGTALGLLVATGLLGIGYEVLAVRVIGQVTENTVYTFAILLATYLLATAAGAAAYHRWRRRDGDPERLRDRLLCGLAAACLLGTGSLWRAVDVRDSASRLFGPGMASALASETVLALTAFALPALLMGALFSHLSTRAVQGGIAFSRALAFNTVGAAAAPLVFGVVLVPLYGAKVAFLLVAAGYWLLASRVAWRSAPALLTAATAAALALLAPPLVFVDVPEGGRVVSYRDGAMAAVSVVEDRSGVFRLRIDNHQQEGSSATLLADARQGLLPLLLHPAPRNALFLGLGTGATASAAAADPRMEVEAVELLPEVIEASSHFRGDASQAATGARLNVIAADARRFVRATSSRYDVIVSDNFHPARSGSGALYTREHFRAVQARLAADGLFCQWLPLHQLDLPTLRSIVRTFLAVFPDGAAMLATNSLQTPVLGLVARAGATKFEVAAVRHRLATTTLPQRLVDYGLADEFAVLGSFVAGAEALAAFAGDAPLNSDDRPVVAYLAPRITYAPDSTPGDRLVELLRQVTIRPADVIDAQVDTSSSLRLSGYWLARNRFIEAGRGIRPTADAGAMLAQVRAPLLDALRLSADFRPAYDPLLAMATSLARTDPAAARALLGELVRLQPARPEARHEVERLAAQVR